MIELLLLPLRIAFSVVSVISKLVLLPFRLLWTVIIGLLALLALFSLGGFLVVLVGSLVGPLLLFGLGFCVVLSLLR